MILFLECKNIFSLFKGFVDKERVWDLDLIDSFGKIGVDISLV